MLLAIDKLLAPRSYWCVGANIGYYGWLLKSSDPGLRVVMFEPDPANVHLIRATLRRSRLSDIVAQPSAVSDTVGIRPLAVGPSDRRYVDAGGHRNVVRPNALGRRRRFGAGQHRHNRQRTERTDRRHQD